MATEKRGEQEEERWVWRYRDYVKALSTLEMACAIPEANALEMDGTIQRFEYTFELAWKTLKDFLESTGLVFDPYPEEIFRLAQECGLIQNAESWLEMQEAHQTTNYGDSVEEMQAIFPLIRPKFLPLMLNLKGVFKSKV